MSINGTILTSDNAYKLIEMIKKYQYKNRLNLWTAFAQTVHRRKRNGAGM